MFTCHACMKRCLQTLIGDSIASTSALRTSLRNRTISQRRLASTSTSTYCNTEDVYHPTNSFSRSSKSNYEYTGSSDRKALTETEKRAKWLESRGQTPADKKDLSNQGTDDFLVRRKLKTLQDPLNLAVFVRLSLQRDEFEYCQTLVRAASKNMQCTVSWNHLIEWQLSKGKLNAALKTYNEMKKRAQHPDAHTYTIIFRGCTEHPDSQMALAKGLAFYHSMLSSKMITPNTIHMNAVLKMCARARDLDAMYTIVSTMPEKGVRAPNNLTYTTILNALRMHAVGDLRGSLTPMQKRQNIRQACLNARRLWADVVIRWRRGDVFIDEELVSAMGRILINGEPRDVDDVLSLVEQTMGIPRQTPRLALPTNAISQKEPSSEVVAQTVQEQTRSLFVDESTSLPEDQQEGQEIAIDIFKAPRPTSRAANAYAKPGRNSLSLVMQVMDSLQRKEAAVTYWSIFTRKFGVIPDAENYHSYLRVLRRMRASADTVDLLLEMPREYMADKTFIIAMSTCERDKNNRNAFANAGKILDVMQSTLNIPNLTALRTYLEVAVSSPAYFKAVKGSTEATTSSAYAQGKQILRALDRLNPSYINIKSFIAYDPAASDKRKMQEDILALTRKMIALCDILMNKGLVEREMYSAICAQRNKFAAFTQRMVKATSTRSAIKGSKNQSEVISCAEALEMDKNREAVTGLSEK